MMISQVLWTELPAIELCTPTILSVFPCVLVNGEIITLPLSNNLKQGTCGGDDNPSGCFLFLSPRPSGKNSFAFQTWMSLFELFLETTCGCLSNGEEDQLPATCILLEDKDAFFSAFRRCLTGLLLFFRYTAYIG